MWAAELTDTGCWLSASATAQYNSSTAQRPEEGFADAEGLAICADESSFAFECGLRNNSFDKVLALEIQAPADLGLTGTINNQAWPITGVFSSHMRCCGCSLVAHCAGDFAKVNYQPTALQAAKYTLM